MLKLEIKATIVPSKLSEFSKTRETLLEKLDHIQDLKKVSSDQMENKYHIKLLFEENISIDDIKQSAWYTYLIGAIEVLGKENQIEIITTK